MKLPFLAFCALKSLLEINFKLTFQKTFIQRFGGFMVAAFVVVTFSICSYVSPGTGNFSDQNTHLGIVGPIFGIQL